MRTVLRSCLLPVTLYDRGAQTGCCIAAIAAVWCGMHGAKVLTALVFMQLCGA